MNPISVVGIILFISSVNGGIRVARSPQGWGSPPPSSGWGSGGTSIAEEGASEALGIGGAIAEHEAIITVVGSPDVPGVLSVSTGSGVGLNQYASNYQQSQINSDGSSSAYQGNSASNSGYAYDYLGGEVQGLSVDVISNGWSAVEGQGAVAQVDGLAHEGPAPSSGSGWKKP